MNQKLEANELNPTMKDAESIESRAENIILAMTKLALDILTLFGCSYLCESLFLHIKFIKLGTRNKYCMCQAENYKLSTLY